MDAVGRAGAAPWSSSEKRALIWTVVVALLARLLHWQSMGTHPWFDFLGLDAKYYDEWAQRILTGGPVGDAPYFMGPLYPHLLAAVYAVVGRSLEAVRLLQVLLSAGTVVGVHLLARVYGGPRLAFVSAGLTALYGPLIYYSVSLLYPTVTAFLAVVLLLSLHRAAERRSLAWTFAAGAALGIFALGRGNILLFAPVAFAWLVLAWGRPEAPGRAAIPSGLRAGAVLAGATLLFILPATMHNLLAGEAALLTTNGGLNLYIGNGPMARGGHETPILYIDRDDGTVEKIVADLQQDVECRTEAEQATGRSMTYTEVSDFYADLTLAYIRKEPGAFLSRLVMKFVHFWSAYEIPQIEHFGYFRQFSLPLRGPVLSFGLMAPLAFVGMVLTWRRRARFALPLLFTATYCAAVVLFFVLARYRMPIVPALLIFAAVALTEMFDAVRSRRWLPVGLAVAGAVVAGGLMRANPYGVDEGRGIAQILYRHGIVADSNGDLQAAIVHYREALTLKPEYARCHMNLGVDLARLGGTEDAMRHFLRSEELDPDYYRAPHNRAQLLEQLGRPEEALAAYGRALELEPRYLLARASLAELLLAEGSRADVEAQLDAIENYDDRWTSPGHRQAAGRAGRMRAYLLERDALRERGIPDCFAESVVFRRSEAARLRGDADRALVRLGEYFDGGGRCAEAYRSLGELLTSANQTEGARDAYERAIAAAPDLPGAHLGLARVAAARGDAELAMTELAEEMRLDPDAAEPHLEAGLVSDRLLKDREAAQEWFDGYLERGGSSEVLSGRLSSWSRRETATP